RSTSVWRRISFSLVSNFKFSALQPILFAYSCTIEPTPATARKNITDHAQSKVKYATTKMSADQKPMHHGQPKRSLMVCERPLLLFAKRSLNQREILSYTTRRVMRNEAKAKRSASNGGTEPK